MDEADAALGWSESEHVVFKAGRRLAVRYQPEWDVKGGRRRQGTHGRIACTWRGRGTRGPLPFCARCVANVLRRFEELRGVLADCGYA